MSLFTASTIPPNGRNTAGASGAGSLSPRIGSRLPALPDCAPGPRIRWSGGDFFDSFDNFLAPTQFLQVVQRSHKAERALAFVESFRDVLQGEAVA